MADEAAEEEIGDPGTDAADTGLGTGLAVIVTKVNVTGVIVPSAPSEAEMEMGGGMS